MRKSASLMCLIGIGLLNFSGCQFVYTNGYSFNYQGVTAETQLTGEFPEGISEVVLENQFGNIQVTPETSSKTGWKWDGKVWADDDVLAELFLSELELTDTTSDGKLYLTLTMPAHDQALNGVQSNLTLNLPEGIAITTVNSHGGTQMTGVKNSVKTTNRHGNVELMNITGNCNVDNSHGNINLQNVNQAAIENSHGNVQLTNALGRSSISNSHGTVTTNFTNALDIDSRHTAINVRNAMGKVYAKTTHGSMNLEKVTGEIELQNQHGSISADEVDGTIDAKTSHASMSISGVGDRINLENRHGSINLNLINSDFQSIDMDTSHANVKLTLPSDSQINLKMDRSNSSSEIPSVSNGAPVRLDTSHGQIRVKAAK